MTVELLWAAVAVAALVVAVAVLVLAVALARVARDARRLVRSTERLVEALERELEPTARQLRALSANLEGLSEEVPPRLRRMDELMDSADATLSTVRSSFRATEEIVRAPLDAVDRARQGVRSVGQVLGDAAGQVIRRVEGRPPAGPGARGDG